MRVLIFVQDALPYPSGNGSAVVTWALLTELYRAGHEAVICKYGRSANGAYPWLPAARALIESKGVRVCDLTITEPHSSPDRPPTRASILLRRLRRSVRPTLDDFFSPAIDQETVLQVLSREGPEVLYLYGMRSIALFSKVTCSLPIVASLVDLPGDWLKAWRKYKGYSSPLAPLYQMLDLIAERKLPEYLAQCLGRCDVLIEHAAHHADALMRKGVHCRYLPNPVQDPCERGIRISPRKFDPSSKMKISLIGSPRGISTAAGLKYLVEKLLPAFSPADRDRFEFHIIGQGDPDGDVLKRLRRYSAVLRGHVTNIDDEFLSSGVLLVPTPMELGFRTRIAEGFAYGCVVVAHQANRAGMPELQSFRNCVLCSRPGEFVEALRQLKEDKALYMKLSTNARATYERCYDSRVVGRKMIDLLSSAAGR